MSSDDIIDNVQPFQQIFEKNLWKDISIKFMSSNRSISTTILPPRVNLTPKLPTTNNPYEFRLLNRGTRDGFTSDSFWNLCDKQKNLVVVMKVKGTDEILGGYNPVGWDKPVSFYHSGKCKNSFIFSLKNSTVQNSILKAM
ncbi:hypothetical protein C2G38_2153073 [Gigaspora rosea]|uniref:TLDc domain-containing protein n=1 Tax=Gigaspora rosea TaxID=44941 RepID=A0A397W9E2_9GLOM|nr:hypothetical protein C2G38_2153073 [Gigaspora rosea]